MAISMTTGVERRAPGKPPNPSKLHAPNEDQKRTYLSLFDSDSDDEVSHDPISELQELTHPPLLHIDALIKKRPNTLSSMLEILLPRLKPRPEVKDVSIEDQQGFLSILVGELASQFSVLQHQVDDPFLSAEENKEFHKKMSIEVCQIIEGLYGKYIYKAAKIRESEFLNHSAKISCLRAQLILEAHKYLEMPSIRRKVVTKFHESIVSGPLVERHYRKKRLPPIPKYEVQRRSKLQKPSLEDLNLGGSLSSKMTRFGLSAVLDSRMIKRKIKKLKKKIPVLYNSDGSSSYEEDEEEENQVSLRGSGREQHSNKKLTSFRLHRRVSSLPELWGEFLLCDMGCTTRHKRPEHADAKETLLGIKRAPSIEKFMTLKLNERGSDDEKEAILLGEHTVDDLYDDLNYLKHQQEQLAPQHFINADDLNPLLQAHIHGLSTKQAARLAQYEASMKEKEEVPAEIPPSPSGSSLLEQSIPSVSTVDQLPYLTIEHASDSGSPHLSLHVKSSLRMKKELTDVSSDGGNLMSYGSASASVLGSGGSSGQLPGSPVRFSVDSRSGSDGGLNVDGSGVLDSLSGASSPLPCSSKGTSVLSSTLDLMEHHQGSTLGEEGISERDLHSVTSQDLGGSPCSPAPVEQTEGGPQPQSAVISTEFPGQGVVRTSDVRVSERTPLTDLRLRNHEPIYNELSDDWESWRTRELDSNLHEGRELYSAYDEIMKFLPLGHLNVQNEPSLEPCIEQPVNLSHILASNSLQHRHSQRIINPNLYRQRPPPWGDSSNRKEWEESNQYQGSDVTHIKSPHDYPRSYQLWLKKWKNTVTPEDYFKYVSKGESDYLRLLYHLYDSEGSDSEDDEEAREKKEKIKALHAKIKAKEERKKQRFKEKNAFEKGMWNGQTVLMGGLGNDPDQSSDEDEEVKFTAKARNLGVIQDNLQQIWDRLQLPPKQQIDMAIKYGGNRNRMELNKVLDLWESVCEAIEKREIALLKLESFEKVASDPSRFFVKGQRGSAALRLEEACKRDRFHTELDALDKKVSCLVKYLETHYGDVVTYQGRNYAEKMCFDRTEMLYWLQQARRQVLLRPVIKNLKLQL